MTEQIEETTGRKFYKTTVTIEIIGEEPWEGSLETLNYDVTEGHFSAMMDDDVEELTAQEVVFELKRHGTDREFFRLDDDGNNIEDEYYLEELDEFTAIIRKVDNN